MSFFCRKCHHPFDPKQLEISKNTHNYTVYVLVTVTNCPS